MNKIQNVYLPTEALSGLIHGYARSNTADSDGRTMRALFYFDVTERSAYSALSTILTKAIPDSLCYLGYSCESSKLRGRTLPKSVALVLPDTLLHVHQDAMTSGILGTLSDLISCTHTNQTQMTIFGESGLQKILMMLRHEKYKEFTERPTYNIKRGDFDLKSNVRMEDLLKLILSPKMIDSISAETFMLGEEFTWMQTDGLDKIVRVLSTSGRTCIMHPNVHRYYFDNSICYF